MMARAAEAKRQGYVANRVSRVTAAIREERGHKDPAGFSV